MYLEKTGWNLRHTTAGKLTSEQSAKNILTKAQSSKSAAPPSASVPRSVSSMIAAAGLPADKLSASIISFARFFSLPLKPQLLADIRRHAFTLLSDTQQEAVKPAAAGNASGNEAAVKNRETLSLAAAAAESKGVELQTKGLEAYAEAVDPDWQKRQDSGGRQRGKRNKNQNGQEKENLPLKTGFITASALRVMTLDSSDKDPLLFILNRLPGKNGQRWIALPFGFSDNDIEYKISLRILLDTCHSSNRAVYMALDISANNMQAVMNSGEQKTNRESERRWLFALESVNKKPIRMSVCLPPEILPKTHSQFAGEMSKLLNISLERIFVKTMTESFPFESGMDTGGGELLRAIDEEA